MNDKRQLSMHAADTSHYVPDVVGTVRVDNTYNSLSRSRT